MKSLQRKSAVNQNPQRLKHTTTKTLAYLPRRIASLFLRKNAIC